jgi:hypothetical protein
MSLPVTHRRYSGESARKHLSVSAHFNSRLDYIPDAGDPDFFSGLDNREVCALYSFILKKEILDFVLINFQCSGTVTKPCSKLYVVYGKFCHLKMHRNSPYPATTILGAKTIGSVTWHCRAFKAVMTISRLSRASKSAESFGSPHGCGMRTPLTILLAPICWARGYIALISATGNPTRSSSLLITAPLRVHVPHVATNRTPLRPSLRISAAISSPMRRMTDGEPWFPGTT